MRGTFPNIAMLWCCRQKDTANYYTSANRI